MKNTSKKFVGYWHYGVILTYASVAAAIAGVCLAATGRPALGVICLFVSGICDSFDGMVARTRKVRTLDDKLFGEQIDSLSDMVAFGVMPVMIGFGMGMTEWYYIIVYCVYVLCALIRLAYFNVTEELRERNEGGARTSYEGLPVTNVAIGCPVFYLVATMFLSPLIYSALAAELVMVFFYLLASFLFVFRFRMPKFHAKGIVVTILITVALIIALFLLRWFVFGVHAL